jgi:16S rRNA processing protein RimM
VGVTAGPDDRRICLGVIVGAQGIKGDVRIKSFTADPGDVGAYGLLSDQPGTRSFRVTVRSLTKGAVVAKVEGVADRNAAEALKGTALYVDRERLPEPEDEDTFYHADLIGLRAEAPDGVPLGRVEAVFDHGAGDVLDIRQTDGRTVSVPFTKAVVPQVDVTAGRIVVAIPEGLAGDAAGEDE